MNGLGCCLLDGRLAQKKGWKDGPGGEGSLDFYGFGSGSWDFGWSCQGLGKEPDGLGRRSCRPFEAGEWGSDSGYRRGSPFQSQG